jgi:DNA-binding NarL/FixJ family response regulator
VLPCVDAMARASWFAALQPVAELALLPVALLSTLAFRVQNESPDAIVLAAGDAPVSGWNQRRSLLAEQPDAALVRSAARLHVYSVLSMELSAQQLVAAVAATAAGLAVMMPLAPTDAADTTPAMEHLTLREVEVLRLMARGYRNKQVATVLNISEHTVKYHVSSVIAKLGARTRTEAVTIGVMRGLVAI